MSKPWEKLYTPEALAFDANALPDHTLADMINEAVERFSTRPALTTVLPTGAATSMTYAEFGKHADHFAIYLREVLGLKQGDTVALMAPNSMGFCVASAGVAKAGLISTNVNPLYTPSELQHQLTDSKAKAMVIIDLFGPKLDEVVAQTGVKHVISVSVLDFFPGLKKAILGFVLKYIKKAVPAMRTPATPLAKAVAMGAAKSGVDLSTYTKGLSPDDVALYQYTSGTTGRSKGAELTHRAVLTNVEQARLMGDKLADPNGDVALVALPLYHITAFTLIFASGINKGNHGILVPSPRPPSNLKKVMENYKISWFTGINTLYAALLNEPWFNRELFGNVTFYGSGGAAQTTGVAQKWQEQTGVEIHQGYGMTEVSGLLTINPAGANKLGKVGIPIPGADVRIVDDAGNDMPQGEAGEVIARTPSSMKGYLGNAEATEEVLKDGWYYTGDIGVLDEDGYLEIVDRKKDMILVSGFNVSPNEIEDMISTLPGVVQVGVIGIEDEKMGEAPAAFVVRKDESLSEDDVKAVCRESLTNYKIPRQVWFVDEVPVTLSGKVLRRELRDDFLAGKIGSKS